MKNISQLAILGATASGKTSLAIELALANGSVILSLDSLSVYKHIDIASAKPSISERNGVVHFGLDVVEVDQYFGVTEFIRLYHDAINYCKSNQKNLIIVGGSSFYLKVLIDGISPLPQISDDAKARVDVIMRSKSEAFRYLSHIDIEYANSISPSDVYRIEKALQIYIATGMEPTLFFREHPPVSVIDSDIPIYEITTPREILRDRIVARTKSMLKMGLVDEVCMLEKRYTRSPSPMKAIGIKETLDYLDGIYDLAELEQKIVINTARLAKRQQAFNRSQFRNLQQGDRKKLKKIMGYGYRYPNTHQ